MALSSSPTSNQLQERKVKPIMFYVANAKTPAKTPGADRTPPTPTPGATRGAAPTGVRRLQPNRGSVPGFTRLR